MRLAVWRHREPEPPPAVEVYRRAEVEVQRLEALLPVVRALADRMGDAGA